MDKDIKKEEFIGLMVHELRSPLSIIHSSADILARHKAELSETKKDQLLDEIKQASEGMLGIVNDLLDSSKISSGGFEITKEQNSITEVISGQISLFSDFAAESGHSFKLNVSDRVPETIPFDKERIAHVLGNLISNAIKFSEGSEILLEVIPFDGYIKISVTDHGVGIDDAKQVELFHKFKQVSKPVDSKQKGTGLGLVVAKGIVELHGGDIGVISKKDEGSTFWFTLPVN
jgi:signal transduction histidine kinase